MNAAHNSIQIEISLARLDSFNDKIAEVHQIANEIDQIGKKKNEHKLFRKAFEAVHLRNDIEALLDARHSKIKSFSKGLALSVAAIGGLLALSIGTIFAIVFLAEYDDRFFFRDAFLSLANTIRKGSYCCRNIFKSQKKIESELLNKLEEKNAFIANQEMFLLLEESKKLEILFKTLVKDIEEIKKQKVELATQAPLLFKEHSANETKNFDEVIGNVKIQSFGCLYFPDDQLLKNIQGLNIFYESKKLEKEIDKIKAISDTLNFT